MNQGHKTWMAAIAFSLVATTAVAIPQQDGSAAAAAGVADASVLEAFYGVPLATSPVGASEDKAVWMAKVQGLVAQAPGWLQQNVLASKSKAEFAANLAILEQMQKGALESAATAVKSVAASGKVSAKGLDPQLGTSNDFVYTPLEPCRIMDTRSATLASGVQGPILGNSLKSIPGLTGTNWGIYGGNATSDCGLNNTNPGGNIYAVALVITILAPNFDAYIGVGDSSSLATILANVAVNFTHGEGISTMYIVPQFSNNIRFAMPAGLSANVIFDVVGYFAISRATALDCVQTALTSSVVANGGTINFDANLCAAGYTEVSLSCHATGAFGGTQWTTTGLKTTGTNDCQGVNNSGISQTYNAARTCCRVPGR